MKVVAFICNLSKGGAQGVFVNVVNYIHKQGISVDIVVQSMEDPVYRDMLDKKISITSLDAPNAKRMILPLKKYLKKNEFTHAFVFGPEIAINLYYLRKWMRRDFRIIARSLNTLTQEYTYADGFFRKRITSNLIRIFFNKIDFAIAQSANMKDDMIANWGVNEEKIVVINNALQPAYEDEAVRNRQNDKENYIMYAGRLEKQKGLEMLLQAFSMLNEKTIGLKIIGSGSLKDDLERQCKDLGIEDRVSFIEHTREIMEYYKKARIVAITSYFEGFPNVLVEAIACGTPVVAYDLPSGPKEIIIEGVNGHLVPYLDVEQFSKTLDLTLQEYWNEETVKKTSLRYMRKEIMPKYIDVLKRT